MCYSAGQLEDNRHGLAASYHDFIAFGLLRLEAFATLSGLVVQLLFASTDLGCCGEFVQQSNGRFVIVCCDAGLG